MYIYIYTMYRQGHNVFICITHIYVYAFSHELVLPIAGKVTSFFNPLSMPYAHCIHAGLAPHNT